MRLIAIFCLMNAAAIGWAGKLGLVKLDLFALGVFMFLGFLTALIDWANRLQRDKEGD